ncbi:hypothetical protein N7520_010065 [Penicillium odoratum]|uniref:uncharacterized protein n=1 Tax=Penicillium odoratum TaxID=1167516 RepID=UPI0025483EA0|nr:uncharacterized protein N7520_010065 [Penicillium odoratum]KAJ5753148.1 hypothetical protein N7520_010065 [Penicillium odoratum]
MKPYSVLAPYLPFTLLKQPIAQPAFVALGGVRHESTLNKWKGSSTDDHSTQRSKKGDTYDIASEASASGMEERQENQGIADQTKSQGTTQRGGIKSSKKAKAEHPAAPEPIIGMNDERAQKGH